MVEPTTEELAAIRNQQDYDAERAADRKKEERRKSYMPEAMRLLPQSPDDEKGVLSSFLIAPTDIGAFMMEKRVKSDWFAIPSHALIFNTLMGMWDKNEPIDFILLTGRLRDESRLDQCGGAAFISELFTFLPTAANCEWYLDRIREKYLLRRGITVTTKYAGEGYDCKDEPDNYLDRLEQDVLAIRTEMAVAKSVTTKEAVVTALAHIEACYDRKGSITGLATGFPDFDRMTDGLHPAELIVIAGRPSNGKTALAMNMAEFITLELQVPVGVFSLEMSTDQLIQRMLCSRSRVNLTRVRDGYLGERDFPALQMAASKIGASRLHIDDTGGISVQELRGKARRMKQQFGIEVLFVDYLQLLKSGTKRGQENRQQEVAEISGGLKTLAKELNIPIVVLAQIKRDFEERASKGGRPRLSDLRESGSIEQDADVVGFIVREDLYASNEDEAERLRGRANLIIAKQRSGPVGDVNLTFLKEYARFETRARGDDPPDDSQDRFPL